MGILFVVKDHEGKGASHPEWSYWLVLMHLRVAGPGQAKAAYITRLRELPRRQCGPGRGSGQAGGAIAEPFQSEPGVGRRKLELGGNDFNLVHD